MRLSELSISKRVAALAVVAGLASYDAAAIEEVVVHGTAPTAVATPDDGLRRQMDAYVQALRLEHKERIDAALLRERANQIQIAAARIPTRG